MRDLTRVAYIKSVASVHKTWRERAEFRLDQLFHGRASTLRALGILLSMSSNVTWSTSWYSALPGSETGLRALLPTVYAARELVCTDSPRRRTQNAFARRLRLRDAVDALLHAHPRGTRTHGVDGMPPCCTPLSINGHFLMNDTLLEIIRSLVVRAL